MFLAVGGGAIGEADAIKRWFSVLSCNKKEEKKISFTEPDLNYLVEQLFGNTIIFASITKNLLDSEEDPGL